MVPAQSPKDLVLEGDTQEGIVQIIIGQLFKEGNTSYTTIDRKALKNVPPLPTGFVPFRDQAYSVTTEAIVSGEHTIVFHLPSVNNQAEFNRLEVLHLEEDELSPLGESWIPITVVANGWDKDTFRFISKATYDQLLPDFPSRRIAAITGTFGTFAIAIAPENYDVPKEPFTQMELVSTSAPETARKNEQVTHTFVIKNNGPLNAEEVNFREVIGPYLVFEAASTSQGRCAQSNRSSDRVVCHLGPISVGRTVTVKIIARVSNKAILSENVSGIGSTAELIFKQRPTDFITEKNQSFVEIKTAVLNDR